MTSARIERCYTDNIYLIESLPEDYKYPFQRIFVIMGHSGHVYNVTISNVPNCTCPDFMHKNRRCKHIYFVLMRIMNINNYKERYFSDEQLEEMFLNVPPVAQNLIYVGEKVNNEEKEVEQKFDKDDICPICLDPLENGKDLDFCRYSCGKTIHKKCFSMWEKTKGSICVFCRAEWHSKLPIKNHKKVSMHPIEPKIENVEKKNQIQNSENDKGIKSEEKKNENNKDKSDKDENEKEKKKEHRYRSRSRSRSRSKKKNLNIDRKNKSY